MQPAGMGGRHQYSILFLHGRIGQASHWKTMMEELFQQRKCYAVDFPEHGPSFRVGNFAFSLLENASLINALICKLTQSGEKLILVGHDVGGAIAQLSALHLPEKIAGLILINSACLTQSLTRVPRGWRIRFFLNGLLQNDQSLQESWPGHYERKVWKKALLNSTFPSLLLWGKLDPMNLVQMGQGLSKLLSNSNLGVNLCVHDELGHWPHLEDPQWVLSKMGEFISRVEYAQLQSVCPVA